MRAEARSRRGDDPPQVALIGCGAVSRLYYAPALRALEEMGVLRVLGVYDPVRDHAAQVAQSFPGATLLREVRHGADAGADLAIVASPPAYHAEQAIQLLRAGVAVLCEKPLAATVAEGEAMIEAAVSGGSLLAVSLVRRFFPASQAVREIIAQGLLGEVRSVAWAEGNTFRWPVRSPSAFQKVLAGGGVLMDLGPHVLDLLAWWFGQPLEAVYADDAMGGVEANCRLTLRFAGGVAAQVRLSRDWPLSNRYVIEGSRGWVSGAANDAETLQIGWPGGGFTLDGRLHHRPVRGERAAPGRRGHTFEQSFVEQLRNVAAAIRGTEPLAVPAAQALVGLRVIEHCYRTRILLSMPWLSARERVRAREVAGWGSGC